MPLPTPSHPSLSTIRSFSTSCLHLAKSTKQRLKYEHTYVPPYPYGPSPVYKQSNFGLYGAQKIRYGNKVSERNEIKTRRYWRPNVQLKRLWSESLRKMVRVRITTRVLRTVDKVGGLDEYLLGDKASRIKELGMGGWKLRWRIMQTGHVKRRLSEQRERLGLEPLEEDVAYGARGEVIARYGPMGEVITERQFDEAIRQIDEDIDADVDLQVGEEGELTSDGSEAVLEVDEARPFMQEETAPERRVL